MPNYEHKDGQYDSYWFHPGPTSTPLSTGLGSSNYITNLRGIVTQRMEYLPFGEMLVEEHKNSNNSPYKFNGKELDEETGNYYYGARYYNPKWSIWLSVDPASEKYPGWSPYNYTMDNPVNLTDPDGRGVEWKPKLNDDGSTTYIKEKGDNEATLKSQYGLSDKTAHKLYSSMENGEISGQSVYNTTGSEVMKLDLNSKQATDQRVIDQFAYATQHSRSKGASAWKGTKYFGNVFNQTRSLHTYKGKMCVAGVNSNIGLSIPWITSRGNLFTGMHYYQAFFSNKLNGTHQTFGDMFGNFQHITHSFMEYGYLFPKPEGMVWQQGGVPFTLNDENSNEFNSMMFKKRPNYHYINTSNNFKN